MMKSRSRRFQGFAVIERPDGALIWGTFRPELADAWAAYERHNPALPDHPTQAQLVAVDMRIAPVAPAS
jgi:hypothetical protein